MVSESVDQRLSLADIAGVLLSVYLPISPICGDFVLRQSNII
jgi:hypothetical protein